MKKFSFLLLLLLFTFCFSSFDFHPYHIGSVEFNHNKKSKTFEITGRFFMDDLESAINKKYGKNLHFQNKKHEKEMQDALKNYCNEYLKLKVNDQPININFIGYEEDKESVDLFLESETIKNPKKIETAVSLMYNLFDDQTNIIHIIVNGVRKSEKLSYPNKHLHQNFDIHTNEKSNKK